MADYQTLLGLALNLGGAIAVAFSRVAVVGTAEPSAYERLGMVHVGPRSVAGSARVQRTAAWWWGWSSIIAGYLLQGLSAAALRFF